MNVELDEFQCIFFCHKKPKSRKTRPHALNELFFCGKNLKRCEIWKKFSFSKIKSHATSVCVDNALCLSNLQWGVSYFCGKSWNLKFNSDKLLNWQTFFRGMIWMRMILTLNIIVSRYRICGLERFSHVWIIFTTASSFLVKTYSQSLDVNISRFEKSNIFEQHRLDMQDFGLEMQVTM